MFGRLAETLIVGTEAAMSVLPRPTIDQHNIRDFNLIGNGVEGQLAPSRFQKHSSDATGADSIHPIRVS